MRALIVYESMFGNTRLVAEAIGAGIASSLPVELANVNRVTAAQLSAIDILVVGGPTHMHGMSRPASREAARMQVTAELPLEADAPGIGVREWLAGLETSARFYAAFDTRIDMASWITGSAAIPIDRLLRHRGLTAVAERESFLVTDDTRLEDGEAARAQAWGTRIAAEGTKKAGSTGAPEGSVLN
jgi:hypothetical protein